MEYLYIGIAALAVIGLLLLFLKNKAGQHRKPVSPGTFGLILVILGIVFSDEGRLISYSLFGVAVLVSIIEIIKLRTN